MLYVVTGNGKGKTTSAIGQGVRAVGSGKRVYMIQFIKSGEWPTGEEQAVAQFSNFELVKGGKGFVGIMGDTKPFAEHREAAQAALGKAEEALRSGDYALVILDEVNVAVDIGLLTAEEVTAVLDGVNTDAVDIYLTGRNAPQLFIDHADLVSEVRARKHPFEEGRVGQKGQEW